MRRRYEVWFLRLALSDASGAWWFRYLLTNPGRAGCIGNPAGAPVQVWATWFPRAGKPETFIQGFPLAEFRLSARGANPFHFEIGENWIGEDACRGRLDVRGHRITWDLKYHSNFHVTLSGKGWIGFSRTPHSDAVFSGEISFDDRTFRGEALGYGLQGHNCGYRHRNFWTWTHAYFKRGQAPASTFEALVYEMPLGLMFRKGVLWHEGKAYEFRDLRERRRDRQKVKWSFDGCASAECHAEIEIDGQGPSIHRLPYLKTNCSSTFEVANNSLARALVRLRRPGRPAEDLVTDCGAVLEMVGDLPTEPELNTDPADWPG
ncbi:MAG TPA: hypothetical protein VEV41_06875 [Terriglobales bacterium]|nr:hypothetical protein [Terriglobales bacterium]